MSTDPHRIATAQAMLAELGVTLADLHRALSLPGRNWVYGRARLELGKLALKAGSTEAARTEFGTAAALADSDNDPMTAADARRLMK